MEINEANHGACIARIMARGSIGKEEARALLEAVGERAEEMKRTGTPDHVVAAAWEMANKLKEVAEERKADAIRNQIVRQNHISHVMRVGIRNGVDYLLGTMYWQPGTHFKDTVSTAGASLTHRWASSLFATIEKAGLTKAFGDPQMFREIANELWDYRVDTGAIMPPRTSPAAQMARAIFDVQEAMRARLNAAGARISEALNWVATTSHDDYLIRRGGRGIAPIADVDESYRAWRDTVTPLLRDDTFKDLVIRPPESEAGARERFLRGVYNALATGVHLTEHREPGGTGPAFEGSFNIARSISQGRVLLWKNADSWAKYMDRYGKSTNWASLMEHAMERGGRQSALLERYGTNPSGNLNLIIRNIAERFRDTDPDGVNKFMQHVNSRYGIKLDNVMQNLDGRSSIATNEMAASIGRSVRQMYDVTLLGAVQLTHASSLVSTLPSEMRFNGVNAFESMGGLMRSLVHGARGDAERMDLLSEIGALSDGMAREAFDPFARGGGRNAPGWGVPGMIAATHNRFLQMTGLPYLFNSAKRGVREMIANKLGRSITGDFSALAPKFQQTLRSYGITEHEWGMLKDGTLTTTSNGRAYLTPATPKSIPDATIETSLRTRGLLATGAKPEIVQAAIAAQRQNMGDHLAMMMEDAASHSVVEAGVRERSFLQGSMPRGSWQSELLAGILQFKTWPLAAMSQVLMREYYQNATKTGFALGALMVGALSMFGGYMRMTARDLLYNQQPRVPRTVGEAGKIALASLAQGGGLGILGDFLFGEAARTGGSFGTVMAGPVAGDVAKLYEIYNRSIQNIGTDHKSDLLPDLTRFAVGHVPFANLVYLKSILDYGIWFHLYNAVRPGWWDRYNQRMQKDQGRATFGYRPGRPIPYVPPAVGSLLGAH